MKKILVGLCTLFILVFAGCAHVPAFDHSSVKEDVYLDPSYSWINNTPNNTVQSLRAVTLRIINKKYRDVDVKIVCHFTDDGQLFGEIVKTVKARDDATTVVRGFARSPFNEKLRCKIRSIR